MQAAPSARAMQALFSGANRPGRHGRGDLGDHHRDRHRVDGRFGQIGPGGHGPKRFGAKSHNPKPVQPGSKPEAHK